MSRRDLSPADLAALNAIAAGIRAAHPIAGATATEGEASRRRHAIDRALLEFDWPKTGHRRVWWTAVLEDATVAGRWSSFGPVDAVLGIAVWHVQGVVRIFEDPDATAYHDMRSSGVYQPSLF